METLTFVSISGIELMNILLIVVIMRLLIRIILSILTEHLV